MFLFVREREERIIKILVIGEHSRRLVHIGEHDPDRFRFLRGFHLFHHFPDFFLHPTERRALLMRLGIGLHFIEWKIIDRLALLIDTVDRFVTELMSETKGDLGAFVRICNQLFRVNPSNLLLTKSDRSDNASTAIFVGLNLARREATSASSACLAGVSYTVDLHIVQILTGVVEVVRAKHHYLDPGVGAGVGLCARRLVLRKAARQALAKILIGGWLRSIGRHFALVWIQRF